MNLGHSTFLLPLPSLEASPFSAAAPAPARPTHALASRVAQTDDAFTWDRSDCFPPEWEARSAVQTTWTQKKIRVTT